MIDQRTKNQLLKFLEKSGNIYYSCQKTGINRATYYEWRKIDPKFKRQSDRAYQLGRINACDIAEYSLMQLVKEKNFSAIKYLLGRLSPKYKPVPESRHIFVHEKGQGYEGKPRKEIVGNVIEFVDFSEKRNKNNDDSST